MQDAEQHSEFAAPSDVPAREQQAKTVLTQLFARAGWKVQRGDTQPDGQPSPSRPDMTIRRGKTSYALELKVAAEGRSDRLIPLWSQAYLQAHKATRAAVHTTVRSGNQQYHPLVVVAAPRVAQRVAEKVLRFAAEYAPDAAVGVIDFEGLSRFRGNGLDKLDSGDAYVSSSTRSTRSVASGSADIFSDLNQWMLKVLLAPELPEQLLSAPRGRYRNASELARAANVSVMSAFRLVQQLEREGYLDESDQYLGLVRREDLFRRWQTSAARRVKEVPMRFLLRRDPQVELKRMLRGTDSACLALFAAAHALHLGFVHGVPPHVYVQRIDRTRVGKWENLVPAERGEVPDIILRQAPAPQSVFRGLVKVDDVPVSDVLQVWLDVSSNPARGEEQADLIRRRIVQSVIDGKRDRG